jgi:hypothetical protein
MVGFSNPSEVAMSSILAPPQPPSNGLFGSFVS